MSNDYELTMDYDMIVSLGKGWFQIDIYDCLDIWNMWLTCVSICKVTYLALVWKGKVTSMLYVYLCTTSYVFMAVWCRGVHGKRDFHEILKKARVQVSLGTMGIESWCLLLVLWFWYFVICWAWFSVLFMFGARPFHFVGVLCCYWFSWFSSCLFLVLAFYVWVTWEFVGKEES